MLVACACACRVCKTFCCCTRIRFYPSVSLETTRFIWNTLNDYGPKCASYTYDRSFGPKLLEPPLYLCWLHVVGSRFYVFFFMVYVSFPFFSFTRLSFFLFTRRNAEIDVREVCVLFVQNDFVFACVMRPSAAAGGWGGDGWLGKGGGGGDKEW